MNEELLRQKQAELLQSQQDLSRQIQNAQAQLQNDELLTHYLNRVEEMRTQMREGGDGVITPGSYMEAMAMQQAMLQQRIEELNNELQRLSQGSGAAPAAPAGGAPPVQEQRKKFHFRDLFKKKSRSEAPPANPAPPPATLSAEASVALLRHEVSNTQAATPPFTPPADTPELQAKIQRARNGQGLRGSDGNAVIAPYKPLIQVMQNQVTSLIERLEGQGMNLPALLENATQYQAGVGSFDCSAPAAAAVESTLELVNQYLRMPAFQQYLKQFYRCIGKGSADAIAIERGKNASQDPHDADPADIHTQAVRCMFTRGVNPFNGALNQIIAKQDSLPLDSPESQMLQRKREALTGLNKIFGKLEVLHSMGTEAPAGLESLMARYQEMRDLCTGACSPEMMEECIREVKSKWNAAPPATPAQ